MLQGLALLFPSFHHSDATTRPSESQLGLHILAYLLRPAQIMEDGTGLPDTTETPPSRVSDSDAPKGTTLPLDVTLRIMGYCNPEDLWQFGQLSRDIRALWIRQARIGSYTILSSESKGLTNSIGILARFTANDEQGVTRHLELAYCGVHLRSKNPDNDPKFKERSEDGEEVYLNFHICPSYADERGQLLVLDSE